MKKHILYKWTILAAGVLILYPGVATAQSLHEEVLATDTAIIERLDGGITSQKEFVGAANYIPVEELRSFPDLNVVNALQGKAPGLIARWGDGGLGFNTSNLFIRGQHTNGNSQAIVIIDGIERSLDDLLVEEIESIEVLKDAVAKVLYGPAAANGIIKVTTKKGKIGKRKIRTTVEGGIMHVTRTPKYLDSYNYATLYNEARANDGLAPIYQPGQLEGYKNSTGVNDLLYPNVDYMNEFTRKQSFYRKATVEFIGGSRNMKYAMVAGYTGANGLEKLGERQNLNRLNLRGNLEIRITDYMRVKAGVGARLEIKDWGSKDGTGIYNAISTNRPNEYPFTIAPENIGMPPAEDGVPYFGTSDRFSDNLYADVVYGGNSSERYMSSQADLGLDLDFNKYIKGLTAEAYLTFDNYNVTRQSLSKVYATYDIRPYKDETGNEQIQFTQKRKQNLPKDYSISNNSVKRTSGWRTNISYNRAFGIHDLGATIAYRYYKTERQGQNQDIIDASYSLRLNYGYDKRYLAETALVYMGSNKFMDDHKYFFSPTVGIGWVLSNEQFMKNIETINFLKLKASFGVLGYAGNTGYSLYQTTWKENGTVGLGEQNKNNSYITSLIRYGNPNLKWEKSAELNIGIEGRLLQNRLRGEINYFHERRWDIIGTNSSHYTDMIGDYLYAENRAEVKNQGVEASISWFDSPIKDFSYEVGLNLTFSKNKLIKADELDNIEDYRKKIGQPTDHIFGLQAEGLFGKDIPLNGHAPQSFGPYQNGDIAYADLNGDEIIDSRDETIVGNNFPRISWGIDVDLHYRNWGLYIQGVAETGVDKLLSNTYYWNTGLGKYSDRVLDRYHETQNPQGSYPRLTSTDGKNSFRNSSYWVRNSAFFRLKNIELSYTFKFKKKNIAQNLKLFARGANLFVISGFKDMDPERPDAGITNYPVLVTYTGGLSVTF